MNRALMKKIMLYFSLAVLVFGLLFVLIIVISGINSSFEATHDSAKATVGMLLKIPGIPKVK